VAAWKSVPGLFSKHPPGWVRNAANPRERIRACLIVRAGYAFPAPLFGAVPSGTDGPSPLWCVCLLPARLVWSPSNHLRNFIRRLPVTPRLTSRGPSPGGDWVERPLSGEALSSLLAPHHHDACVALPLPNSVGPDNTGRAPIRVLTRCGHPRAVSVRHAQASLLPRLRDRHSSRWGWVPPAFLRPGIGKQGSGCSAFTVAARHGERAYAQKV
jgi:hypothetical protein